MSLEKAMEEEVSCMVFPTKNDLFLLFEVESGEAIAQRYHKKICSAVAHTHFSFVFHELI